MTEEVEICEQAEREKHDEKLKELNNPFCPNCNKPMWEYTYIGECYFYCSFCYLTKKISKEIKENE